MPKCTKIATKTHCFLEEKDKFNVFGSQIISFYFYTLFLIGSISFEYLGYCLIALTKSRPHSMITILDILTQATVQLVLVTVVNHL